MGDIEAVMLWKLLNNSTCPFGGQEQTDSNTRSVKSRKAEFSVLCQHFR